MYEISCKCFSPCICNIKPDYYLSEGSAYERVFRSDEMSEIISVFLDWYSNPNNKDISVYNLETMEFMHLEFVNDK